jgi:hypothetical protein
MKARAVRGQCGSGHRRDQTTERNQGQSSGARGGSAEAQEVNIFINLTRPMGLEVPLYEEVERNHGKK